MQSLKMLDYDMLSASTKWRNFFFYKSLQSGLGAGRGGERRTWFQSVWYTVGYIAVGPGSDLDHPHASIASPIECWILLHLATKRN